VRLAPRAAEVSADGWNWAVGAEANSYVQHAWPQNYGGQTGYCHEMGLPNIHLSQKAPDVR
jgi:hypothetical protein